MSMSNQRTLREYLDAYNRAEWTRLADYVGPTYVHHNNDAVLTIAQFTSGASWLRAGIPDFRIEVKTMVAEAEMVAVRWEANGTHSGSLAGEVPTGRAVTLYGITLYRFEDGLIAEDWEATDERHLRTQIGLDTADQ